MYRSTDNGITWDRFDLGIRVNVNDLLNKDSLLFIATYSGIIRISAKGDNRVLLKIDNDKSFIQHIYACGNYLFAATSNYLYRSVDNGDSWSLISRYYDNIVPFGNNLYAREHNEGIFCSTDNGDNWTSLSKGITDSNYVSYISTDGKKLVAGTSKGNVYVYLPESSSWENISNGYYWGKVNTVAIKGNTIYVGTSKGVYRSTNKGVTWEPYNKGLKLEIRNIAAYGSVLFAWASANVYRSTDKGENWILADKDMMHTYYGSYFNILPIKDSARKDSALLMIISEVIYKSIDNGMSWSYLPGCGVGYFLTATANDSVILVGGGGFIYCVKDHDNTGELKIKGLSDYWINNMVTHNSKIYAATGKGGINCSADNGDSWFQVNNGLPKTEDNYESIKTLLSAGLYLYAATFFGEVYRSSDDGATWTKVQNEVFPKKESNIVCFGKYNNILFAGTLNGVLISKDNGDSWNLLGVDTIKVYPYGDVQFSLSSTDLYIRNNEYWWSYPLNKILNTEKESLTLKPEQFSLKQNFPNPFNPSTTITFSINKESFVRLKIYDLLGREVSTLIDEKLKAGNYKNEWNASDIPSGIYFIRLQADGYTETRKMTLLK